MRNLTSSRLSLIVLLIIALLTAACGSAGTAPAAPTASDSSGSSTPASSSDQKETISISGAFALFPMVTVWADEYQKENPNVQFDIQGGGAGKGMTDVLAGAVDVAMVSREIRPEEKDQGAYGIPVTIDAVVGTVNADNPHLEDLLKQGITPETGAKIWMTGETTTWDQLLGNGATEKINVYTRSDASGAGEMWARFLGGKAQEELLGTAVNADPGVAEAVRQDPLGVGYNNIGFAYDLSTGKPVDGLQIIPLDLNGDGQINPDEDFYSTKDEIVQAIGTRVYPFPPARELYLVTKGEPSPAVASFINWILTNGQSMVTEAGYVKLDDAKIQAALELLK